MSPREQYERHATADRMTENPARRLEVMLVAKAFELSLCELHHERGQYLAYRLFLDDDEFFEFVH
jgi:hypothetical protein